MLWWAFCFASENVQYANPHLSLILQFIQFCNHIIEAGQNTAQSVGSGHNAPNPFGDDDDDDEEVNDSGPLTSQDIEDFHDRASNSEDHYKGSASSMQSGHEDPPGDRASGSGGREHAQSHFTTNSAETEGTTNTSKVSQASRDYLGILMS